MNEPPTALVGFGSTVLERPFWVFQQPVRDGTQSEGIAFSVQDKLMIARKLDELGVDYIEGGWFECQRRRVLRPSAFVQFESRYSAGCAEW